MAPLLRHAAPLLLAAATTACAAATGSNRWAVATAADSAAAAALREEAAGRVAEAPANAVTVLPFGFAVPDTSLEPLRFALADLLLTDLAQSAQLTVVDRLRTDALVRELGYATAALDDTLAAARFGRLVGARRAVVGAVAGLPDQRLRLDARVADASTGMVRAAGNGSASLDDLLDAEKALALQVFEGLGVTLTPAERERVLRKPTRNLAALLAYGRGVRQELLRNFRQARVEFREAARLDPDFEAAMDRLALVPELPPATGVATVLATYGVSPIPAPREADAGAPLARTSGARPTAGTAPAGGDGTSPAAAGDAERLRVPLLGGGSAGASAATAPTGASTGALPAAGGDTGGAGSAGTVPVSITPIAPVLVTVPPGGAPPAADPAFRPVTSTFTIVIPIVVP